MTSTERPRFAHLIYTSYDDGSGAGGGWQVKDSSGDLDAAERDLLTAWVSTRFDLQPALDRYPTPQAIEARQRRLMYSTVKGGAAYWHTAEAGTDGSGRPGNVFAHVVLDRSIDDAVPAFRPVELWMSPSWLMPYGPAATKSETVSSTSLPDAGEVATRDRVLSFLTDITVFRLGLFQVLLDSVAHAWNGGPQVVLLTENSSTASLWIGAVSYFMSPGTSRHFNWSTHDRADAIAESVRRGIHLAVVPASERDSLGQLPGIVVLDERDDPTLGVLDEDPHRTHTGVSVEVTPWSMLAQAALIDHETALIALRLQDEIAAEAVDEGFSPTWPLAMAIASMPSIVDVTKETARVISEERPSHLRPESRLAQLSDRIDAASAPKTLSEAKTALLRAQSRSRNVTGALSDFVRLAIRNDDWMAQHPAAEIGAEFTGLAPGVFAAEVKALIVDLGGLASDPLEKNWYVAVRIMRIADVLMVTNSPAAVSFDLVELQCRALETVASELLDPVAGQRIVQAVGSLAERTLCEVVRPTLAAHASLRERPFGRRFDGTMIRWLFPSEPKIPSLHQIAEHIDRPEFPRHDIALFSEFVYGSVLLGWKSPRGDSRMKEIADLAVWGILDDQQNRLDPDDRVEDIRSLCRLGSVSLEEAGTLFRTFGGAAPAEVALRSVLYERPSKALAPVLAQLTALRDQLDLADGTLSDADRVTISWGILRGLADWADIHWNDVDDFIERHLDRILLNFDSLVEGAEIAQDLLTKLAMIYYVAQSIGHDLSKYSEACTSRLTAHAESRPDVLRALIGRGIVDVSRIAGRSFVDFIIRRQRHMDGQLSREDELISDLVSQRLYSGPSDTDSLRDAMWPLVREMTARDAETIFGSYLDYAGLWLESRGIRAPTSQSWSGRESGLPW